MEVLHFTPRFVPEHLLADLSNLWHLSRTISSSRYERLIYTSKHFSREHGLSRTAVYKDLGDMLAFGGR